MIIREVNFSFSSYRIPPTGNYFPLAWKPHKRVQELFLARNKSWQTIQHYEKRKLLFLVGHVSKIVV